jgi:hypothetical protein
VSAGLLSQVRVMASPRQLTMRAADGGESARFMSLFLASSFPALRLLYTPAPCPPLTRAVSWLHRIGQASLWKARYSEKRHSIPGK